LNKKDLTFKIKVLILNKMLSVVLCIGVIIITQKINVGVVLPLSGSFSSYGKDCLRGMSIAEVPNCSLIIEDNEGDEDKTIKAIKKLISQGASIIVGPLISANVIKAAYYIDSINIPLIIPITTHPRITKISNWVYRLSYTDDFGGKTLANFVYFVLRKRRPALFIEYTSPYSIELANIFKKRIQELGSKIVITEAYSNKDTDFRDILSKIANAKPDCIFVPGYYSQVGSIIKQARELGIKVPFLGGNGWDSIVLLDLVGEESGLNFYYTSIFAKAPELQEFRHTYIDKFGVEPTSFSALGYDAISLVGSLKLEDTEPETFLKELSKVSNFKGITGKIDFTKSRDPHKTVSIIRLEKGALFLEQKSFPTIK
jgi:branched-chain amino acid transport system substrate-binding protein